MQYRLADMGSPAPPQPARQGTIAMDGPLWQVIPLLTPASQLNPPP